MAGRPHARWSRKLKPPVALKSGARLSTLTDARTLISLLPEASRRAPYWEYASALLTDAAQSGEGDLDEVRAQLMRALRAEGLA